MQAYYEYFGGTSSIIDGEPLICKTQDSSNDSNSSRFPSALYGHRQKMPNSKKKKKHTGLLTSVCISNHRNKIVADRWTTKRNGAEDSHKFQRNSIYDIREEKEI